MNVDMLSRLNSDSDSTIVVRTSTSNADGSPSEPIEVSLAELTALTSELVFPLVNPSRVPEIENIDLLDFPGYRGRLAISSLQEIEEVQGENPVSQLILRGKVAYLFERYTDSQEMNILLVCTPSTSQLEVNSVGPVLERWIQKTQGLTPQERTTRKSGLLWAMTMFDKRVSQDLDKTETMLKNTWGQGGLLQQTILERFGNYEWLNHWANDKPFDNVFLVRKPGFQVPFLDMNDTQELGIAAAQQKQVQTLRNTFIADKDIQKHISHPEDAWDAMLKLNDGGMQRISDYIETIAKPETKTTRLTEQLNAAIKHITEQRFDTWYQQDGEAAVQQKEETANTISECLQRRGMLVGELLRCLELPKETIRNLYLSNYDSKQSTDSEADITNEIKNEDTLGFSDDFGFGQTIDLTPSDSVVSPPGENTITHTQAQSPFAQKVFSEWVTHLRELSQQPAFLNFFGLPADIVDKLTGELITAANRYDLQNRLIEVAILNEQAGNRRDELVERQAFSLFACISDFIAWLNVIEQPLDERPTSLISRQPVFEPIQSLDNLPNLSDVTQSYTQHYVLDWLLAFKQLTVNNAGHSAGREITPVQNAQLGKILRTFQAAIITE